MAGTRPVADVPLDRHLMRMFTAWLGVWPAAGLFRVVPSARRMLPGAAGRVEPLLGVAGGLEAPSAVVLSVPPLRFAQVGQLVRDLADQAQLAERRNLATSLPAAVGHPDGVYAETVLCWTHSPAPHTDVGTWHLADDPALPRWLRPLGPRALVSTDKNGRFLAGVGVLRHNAFGHELIVGTAKRVRGQGLATALVAQAACRVRDSGAVPLVRYDPRNAAAARVAVKAGFEDRGWRSIGLQR